MLYISYYSKKDNINNVDNAYVSISVGTPKWPLPYQLWHCEILKPYSIFGKYDNMVDYEREYRKVLDRIGVDRIRKELDDLYQKTQKKNLVLLCYEKDKLECHRWTFAKWWYENTGEIIQEIDEQLNIFDFI